MSRATVYLAPALVLCLGLSAARAGTIERVSVSSSGGQGNGDSIGPAISADGRVVAFWSNATNLVADDTNGVDDVFVHDRLTGVTERVSVDSSGAQGMFYSVSPAISADGRFVAFVSVAALAPPSSVGFVEVFVRDRLTGTTELVSRDFSGSSDAIGDEPAISADGRFVAFQSGTRNVVLGDTNGTFDVFVRDRLAGTNERVSVSSSGVEGNGPSDGAAISADGRFVTFFSGASNLV